MRLTNSSGVAPTQVPDAGLEKIETIACGYKLHSLLNQGRREVLLNLENVNYVDSAGLGAIVGAYTTMTREGGTLKLANVTKKLQDLLSITKLLTVFETFDSEAEALRSYRH